MDTKITITITKRSIDTLWMLALTLVFFILFLVSRETIFLIGTLSMMVILEIRKFIHKTKEDKNGL